MFHIRAKRMDLCFELATQIMLAWAGRFRQQMKCMAFVISTSATCSALSTERRPDGTSRDRCGLCGAEDAVFSGGSYVIVQKYLHDLAGWNALSTEVQERIIGRAKLSDIELDDATKRPTPTTRLTTIEVDGKEIKIVRDNMPFGGWPRRSSVPIHRLCAFARTTEQMLENMFVGQPPGNYDRCLISVSLRPATCSSCRRRLSWRISRRRSGRGSFRDARGCSAKACAQREGSLDIGSLKENPSS